MNALFREKVTEKALSDVKWREDRAAKPQRETPSDRRTLKVNGQEVVAVKKKPKPRIG
jgi:hypothetical protein